MKLLDILEVSALAAAILLAVVKPPHAATKDEEWGALLAHAITQPGHKTHKACDPDGSCIALVAYAAKDGLIHAAINYKAADGTPVRALCLASTTSMQCLDFDTGEAVNFSKK